MASKLVSMGMLFKDLHKKPNDILSDDFKYSKSVKIKTVTPNGLQLITDGSLSGKGAQAKLTGKYIHQESGIQLDKLEVTTDGRVLGEASLRLDPSMKFMLSVEDGRHDPGRPIQSYGKLGAQYITRNAALDCEVDVVNGPVLSNSLLVTYRNFHLGYNVKYNTQIDEKDKEPEFLDHNLGIGYIDPMWQCALSSVDSMSSLSFSFVNTVNSKSTIAAKMDFSLVKNAQKLTIGAAHRLGPHSLVRAKVDSSAIVSMAFAQTVDQNVKMVVSGEVDTKDWAADTHKFGLSLTFG